MARIGNFNAGVYAALSIGEIERFLRSNRMIFFTELTGLIGDIVTHSSITGSGVIISRSFFRILIIGFLGTKPLVAILGAVTELFRDS